MDDCWQKRERCGVRNDRIKLYYWTDITIASIEMGKIMEESSLYSCQNCQFAISLSIHFQLTSNFSRVCARFFLLLNVLWNKTLSFFWCCHSSLLSISFFFLIVFLLLLLRKIKMARGNCRGSLGNQRRRKNWSANHSIWVFS